MYEIQELSQNSRGQVKPTNKLYASQEANPIQHTPNSKKAEAW